MTEVHLQIIDIISCIDNAINDDLEKISHDDETDPSVNLYCDKNQRVLSAKNEQLIKIFGRTNNDESIVVNVRGFLPFFYLGFEEDITQSEASSIVAFLKRKANFKYQSHLVKWELIYRQPYEKFVGNQQFPFLKLYFRNKYSFKEFERIAMRERTVTVLKKIIPFYIGESNLDEVLKFIHQTDIRPTSWIKVTQYKSRITKSAYVKLEVDSRIDHIHPVENITNSQFKVMIYDIECQSQLGELGDFPVAKKNYQKLARELIDLWTSNSKHELVKNELVFPKVIETCLRLVFTPNFYSYGIRQVKTKENLKPTESLVEQTSDMIVTVFKQCEKQRQYCFECTRLISYMLIDNFPTTSDPTAYFYLSRQIWINLNNLTRHNYNKTSTWEELHGPIYTMLKLAFEDYYDGFSFSPIDLKGRIKPQSSQLYNLTPMIQHIITNAKFDYETKLNNLTEFLNKQLSPIFPKGDPIIQIGFTMQRLGTPHPYLKGIYTVDSCKEFSNEDLVYDENNTELSQREVDSLIAAISKREDVQLSSQEELIKYLSNKQRKEDKSQVLIRSFSNESAMIKAFGMLINTEDPDMIGGYNSFGFDDRYLAQRTEELNITESVLTRLSRLKHDISTICQPAGAGKDKEKEEQKGKRKMETHYLEMKGRIPFDIYRIIPNNYNLPEYKLNYVCKHFLKKQKNDVPPTQIPILQRGSSEDRSLVARYCIIDCILCNRLLAKLSIINNLIAMSNVSLVPIRYLLFRGQTIKGFSLIVKKCSQRGKIVKTLRRDEKPENTDKYEGAIVLDPLIDIYNTPISVADFNSLYPSSMISENISNDTLVTDLRYDNLPGFHYNTIEYDEFVYQQARHKRTGAILKRMEKIKKPEMRRCRFVGNMKGILPEIEEELIASRKAAKKKMAEYEAKGDSAMAAAWDCQQLAYKITCNSIYGITGASVSPIYNKDVAASITATGRKMIIFSKNYVEQTYKNLAITLKEANLPSQDIIVEKAVCVYGDSVAEYTPILIRHNGKIKTVQIKDLAMCDQYRDYHNGKEVAFLNGYEIWSDKGWTRIKHVIRHRTDKQMYRVLTHNSLVDVTKDHSLLDQNGQVIKPEESLNKHLLQCSYPVDISANKNMIYTANIDGEEFRFNSQLEAVSLYRLYQSMGYTVSLDSSNSEYDLNSYTLTINKKSPVDYNIKTNVVKKVIQLPKTEQFVYDIETENHHFSAGIGELVVHNTDSIFIRFDMHYRDNKEILTGLDAVFASMEICGKAAKEISLQLKAPQNLEFEKTIYPFLLINKKMYKGHYYTKMNKDSYYENTMGFATKKRDSAPIAKIVVDGLTDLLFSIDPNKLDQATIRNYLTDKFKRILNGEYPLEFFIRTKSWKGHYANPDQIAQHVLAVRQAIRDPGNQFQVNDRIPFIHIVNPKSNLQGDKIETVDFVTRNRLKIDYKYYIEKQLINPLLKILSPNRRLGVTEKWLINIMKNLSQERQHVATMDKFFTIIPKQEIVGQFNYNDYSSSSDSE